MIAEDHPSSRSMFIARACAVVSMVVGCVVLVGYVLDVTALKAVVPGRVTMKANAAPSFVLAVRNHGPTESRPPRLERQGR